MSKHLDSQLAYRPRIYGSPQMAEESGVPVETAAAAAKVVGQASKTHGNLDVSGLLTVLCGRVGLNLDGGSR